MKFEIKENLNSDTKKLKSILPKIIKYTYNFFIILSLIIIAAGVWEWYMQDFEANQFTPMSMSELHGIGWLSVNIIGMILAQIIFKRYIKVKI